MTETAQDIQGQLAQLREMRASGVKESEFEVGGGGLRRRVVFRSDDELAAAIADLERRLALLLRPRLR